jgi:hypothetical protein
MKKWMVGLIVVLSIRVASASITGTYVDATAGNTQAVGGGDWISNGDEAGHWRYYTGWSDMENGDVFITDVALSIPEIYTTVTGLPQGTYDVYVVYWSWIPGDGKASNLYAVQAKLGSGGTYQMFDEVNGTPTGKTGVGGALWEYEGYLGQVTGTSFDVYVSPYGALDRNTYDGVSYTAVPEPATLGLISLGLVGIIRRRNR